ncbi:Oidioi.mRNA.OKI2018_I69.PAR.g13044.t1.cds [Oikopleura dioica]|uniref:Oidioi.mRNA.OKI2018_I69.PAR.g13044.t1.cds n=1 Tax=Oikopleura dioica TaxID=34765 RepID=A0ABN7S6C0_OIKDI|nr:Oidioi.mRNA.OKI2018_I69.PAR.g13044.t1.cds [Oikopleura dioica]
MGGGYGGRPNKSLFVRNIADDIDREELEREFSRYGSIRDVYVPLDYYSKRPRGFAYIQFCDKLDAKDALEGMDGRKVCGRYIDVQYAKGDRKSPGTMRSEERGHSGSYHRRRSRSRSRSRRDRRRRSRSDSRRRRRTRSRSRSSRRRRSRSYRRERSSDTRRRQTRSRSRSISRGESRRRSRSTSRNREKSEKEACRDRNQKNVQRKQNQRGADPSRVPSPNLPKPLLTKAAPLQENDQKAPKKSSEKKPETLLPPDLEVDLARARIKTQLLF